MKYKLWLFTVSIFFLFSQIFPLLAQEPATTVSPPPASVIAPPGKLTMIDAVICEDVKELKPFNPAIVFSIASAKISCFTTFEPVPEKTLIYHNWYRTDKLSTKIKLTLNSSPRWSTYSSIQLRETDKGPWRVEITDQEGNIFQILRFSITD